jgi:hypothetical protein
LAEALNPATAHIAKSLVKRQAPFPHSVLFLCFSFGIRRFYFTGQAALVSAGF